MPKEIQVLLNKIMDIVRADRNFHWVLLGLSFISFGFLIPALGLYSDDWHLFWLAYRLDYVQRFFLHNRPYLGEVYNLITKVIPPSILAWHIVLFFLKWSAAVWLWHVLKKVLFKNFLLAKWICLLFVFYPGNLILFQPLVFTVAIIQINLFLLSLWLCLQSLHHPEKQVLFTLLSLLAAVANLIASEYFFFLELLRPVFIWMALGSQKKEICPTCKKTFKYWLPYLIMFTAVLGWRSLYQSQLTSQQPWVLQEFIQQPWPTLLGMLSEVGRTIYLLFVTAWNNPVLIDQIYEPRTIHITLYFLGSVILVFILLFNYFKKNHSGHSIQNKIALAILITGIAAVFLGGLPVWLAKFHVDLGFRTENRFIMPFLLGISFCMAGGIFLIIQKHLFRIILLSITVALGVGFQFLTANLYRQEWVQLKTYYWQLYWRVPQMQTGVHLVTNPPPLHMEGENSLSAAVNWIYGRSEDKKQIDYYLYFLEERMQDEVGDLIANKPITIGHQIGDFSGSDLKIIAYQYAPPGCLQLLDPSMPEMEAGVSSFVMDAARISDPGMIHNEQSQVNQQRIEQIFGREPESDWCYFYEKADLARQFGEWQEVVTLYDQADEMGLLPAVSVEWLPLIEASAHLRDWQTAFMVSQKVSDASFENQPLVCNFWRRIIAAIQPSKEDMNLINTTIIDAFKCEK